jgi:hypothetical protein
MNTSEKLTVVRQALSRADLTNITLEGIRQLLRDKAELSVFEIFLVWRSIS